jgi:hypothetical protein
MNMVSSSPPTYPSSIFSPDATAKLGQAIKFMVTTFLNEGLVQKADVVNLLEEIIQTIEKETQTSEKDPTKNTNGISGT